MVFGAVLNGAEMMPAPVQHDPALKVEADSWP
jgi:hypothetical protein